MDKINIIKDLIKIAETFENNDKVLLANTINLTIAKLAEIVQKLVTFVLIIMAILLIFIFQMIFINIRFCFQYRFLIMCQLWLPLAQ